MSNNTIRKQVNDLIDKLKSSDLEVRQQAVWDLHKLGEEKIEEAKEAIPTLIEACKDNDWAVRKIAVMALGELNVREEVSMIIDFLRNDIEPEVRVGAAEALGDMQSVEAVDDLIKALDDSYSMVRQVAMWSLGQIGKNAMAAAPKILEFLLKPEDDNIIQVSDLAAWALGKIGDKTAIEPLRKALEDVSYSNRKFIIAYSLALLEGLKGEGYSELMRMKKNNELDEYQLNEIEKLQSGDLD